MSGDKTGGQAFPSAPPLPFSDGLRHGKPGMTLRDWFAGQALAGISSTLTEMAGRENGDDAGALLLQGITGAGSLAYALADAMLAARPTPSTEEGQ